MCSQRCSLPRTGRCSGNGDRDEHTHNQRSPSPHARRQGCYPGSTGPLGAAGQQSRARLNLGKLDQRRPGEVPDRTPRTARSPCQPHRHLVSRMIKVPAALSPCAPGPCGGSRVGAHGQLRITFAVVACVTTGRGVWRLAGRLGCPGPLGPAGCEEAGHAVANRGVGRRGAGRWGGRRAGGGRGGLSRGMASVPQAAQAFTSTAARYGLQTAAVAAAARRGRLPPRVVHDLRRRINGPPQVW